MKELVQVVEKAVKDELMRANGQWPLFASDHEGESVINEEVQEAAEMMKKVRHIAEWIRDDVYSDNHKNAADQCVGLRRHAIYGACELIQVAAMADKFVVSALAEKSDCCCGHCVRPFTQEEADALAKTCPEMTAEEKEVYVCELPSFLKSGRVTISVPKAKAKAIVEAVYEEGKDVK